MRQYKIELFFTAVALASAIAMLITFFVTRSWGNPDSRIEEIQQSILILQPSVDESRAHKIASIIVEASRETGLEDKLLVAVINRESAFLPEVESLDLLGKLGERGLLQVHGVGLNYRPDSCTTKLDGAWCQIHTGARFLEGVKSICGGSTWRWLGAYGMSQCPSEEEAKLLKSTRVAKRHYDEIGGELWVE